MAINLHLVFIIAMIFIAILNLYFILFDKDFASFSQKIYFIAPQYYMVLAALFFTGIVVLGVTQMQLSLQVVVMIIAWFVIFITSIKNYKKYKLTKTHPKNLEHQDAFRAFAKRKYSIDIAVIALTSLISYMV